MNLPLFHVFIDVKTLHISSAVRQLLFTNAGDPRRQQNVSEFLSVARRNNFRQNLAPSYKL